MAMSERSCIAWALLVFVTAHPALAVDRVTASDFAQTAIYHSPQTPGYTAWCALWRARDGGLRVAFQQVTGAVEDAAKRKNMTVILGSADEAATWKTLREVPARTRSEER